VFRSSRNIALTLVGSAALFGCCLTSCVNRHDEPERDANGNVVHDANGNVVYRHHYYYRPWFYSGGYHGYPLWYSSPYSSYSSSSSGRGVGGSGGGVGGTSRPGTGTTTRGGFGTTGHATAGS
jgi:hypothetical protein